MAITQEFRDAVDKKDIRLLKIMLKNSLVVDPTFKEFDEMLDLVKTKGLNLYDKHNGEVLKYDESKWTDDYIDKQMVQLVYNFSEERVKLLKVIFKKLYTERIEIIETKRRNASNSNVKINKDQVGTGLIIIGTVATVGEIALESAILTAVAAGEIALESAAIAAGVIAIKPVVIATGVSMIVVGGAMKVMGGKQWKK